MESNLQDPKSGTDPTTRRVPWQEGGQGSALCALHSPGPFTQHLGIWNSKPRLVSGFLISRGESGMTGRGIPTTWELWDDRGPGAGGRGTGARDPR